MSAHYVTNLYLNARSGAIGVSILSISADIFGLFFLGLFITKNITPISKTYQ